MTEKDKQKIYCGKCGTSVQFYKTQMNHFNGEISLVTSYQESCLECNSLLHFKRHRETQTISVQTISVYDEKLELENLD